MSDLRPVPPCDQRQIPRLAKFPIDPARTPFFYGWLVLLCGTLGVLASAPGQTVGVSVFTDHLMAEHGLSRNLLSIAYCVGTLGSALLITRAGRIYDRLGGRWVSFGAAVALSIVLLELSYSVEIKRLLMQQFPETWDAYVSFVLLTLSFFVLRFFGQGVLTLSSRNMVMEWFEQRRGMATAFVGISVAFGFSITPKVFESLINTGGWQWAWRIVAMAVSVFAILVFCFGRSKPEDHGLLPDGPLRLKSRISNKETAVGRQFTLNEARRTYSFWVFTMTSLLSGLLLTAFSFHVVSIFSDAGHSRERAVAIFLPAAFVSVAIEFAGSWLSDFAKLKYLAMIQLLGTVLLSLGLTFMKSETSMGCIVLGMGLMQGLFGIVSGVTWPRFFGRANLGAISGFSTSIVVAGTAVGPFFFSYVHEQMGSYRPATLGCGVFGVLLLLASFRADRPS